MPAEKEAHVYMPPALHRTLKAEAIKNVRSLNAEIVVRLQASVKK